MTTALSFIRPLLSVRYRPIRFWGGVTAETVPLQESLYLRTLHDTPRVPPSLLERSLTVATEERSASRSATFNGILWRSRRTCRAVRGRSGGSPPRAWRPG